jgi:hypothetical protein
MIWNSKSFEFTATSDLTKIAFQSLTPGYYGPAIDNINVEVVPIPSGLLLLGSGLAALIAYKRKHRS